MTYNFIKVDDNKHEPSEAYKGGYCPIKIGMIINNYTIEKFMGEGSYSQVWRALDKKNNIVILKIHKGNKKDNTVGINEYKILETLNHPNIIKVYGNFVYKSEMGKHYVMVIEYLGDTLSKCKYHFRGDFDDKNDNKQKECIPMDVLKRLMNQLLSALNYLHNDKKLIHTDLKLDNIMLTKRMYKIKNIEDFTIKLIDFGTSHNINSKANYNIGTIEYNSPEMIIGYPYNSLTDIWSCGCICFELLTGYCLFDYGVYYKTVDDIEYNSKDTVLYSSNDSDEEEETYHIENLILAMMTKVLGKMPGKIFKRGKYFDVFFTNKGYLKSYPRFLNEEDMYNYLKHEFDYNHEKAEYYTDFLLLMLNNNPDKRLNAKKILENKFLKV